MPDFVTILEDNADRIAAMQSAISRALPNRSTIFFEDAAEMIAWLQENLACAVLISLDHDLPLRTNGDQKIDCGTGRQVAEYLANQPPTCPIIVHSSNAAAASAMVEVLTRAQWPCSRVYPHDDIAWIGKSWLPTVERLVDEGWIKLAQN